MHSTAEALTSPKQRKVPPKILKRREMVCFIRFRVGDVGSRRRGGRVML
jgi:hypothetical protein